MGFLRSTSLVLITSLLFLSLIFFNLFTTISWSLEHETLYPEVQEIAKKTLEEYNVLSEIKTNFPKIEMACFDREFFAYNSGEYSLKIPCEVIKRGYNETISYGIGAFINETYYKEYDCEILECIKEKNQPFVLISEKTQDFFKEKSRNLMIISLILASLTLIISKKKHNSFITLGILTILSALPFKKLNWLSSLFEDSIVFEFLGVFFIKSNSVYLIMMILGISFLVVGITLFLLKYGLKISSWFRKKEKEIEEKTQKEEIKENITEIKKTQEETKQIKNEKRTTEKKRENKDKKEIINKEENKSPVQKKSKKIDNKKKDQIKKN